MSITKHLMQNNRNFEQNDRLCHQRAFFDLHEDSSGSMRVPGIDEDGWEDEVGEDRYFFFDRQ